MIGDDPVERGQHLGVAEVDLGEPDGGLGVLDLGRRLVGLRFPLLDRGLAGEVAFAERRLSLIFGLVVFLRRFVRGERRLLLVDLRLIDVALDAKQLRALLDHGAVDVVDRGEEALHARDKVDGGERRRYSRSARGTRSPAAGAAGPRAPWAAAAPHRRSSDCCSLRARRRLRRSTPREQPARRVRVPDRRSRIKINAPIPDKRDNMIPTTAPTARRRRIAPAPAYDA